MSYIILYSALLYHLLLEGFTGYTVGKYIVRIQVVQDDGRPPGLIKSLLRTLTRLVETNPILFGAIPAGICVLVTKKKQRLGDMAANTYVVKVADLKSVTPSRRNKMALSAIFLAIILFAVVPNVIAWTTTGYPESKPQSVVHMSEDGKFQLTDSGGLKRDSSEAAEYDANLVLSNSLKTKYIFVFTYSKEEMGRDLTAADFYFSSMQVRLQDSATTLIQERNVDINGGLAYELTYRMKVDGDDFMYIVTYIETPEHFHEMVAIMEESNYERYGSDLRATMATLSEVKSES